MKQNHWSFTKQQLADSQLDSAMDIENIRRDLYDNFYEELEATVCNIVAAGVPLSDICISSPKLTIVDNIARLQGHIRCYP